MRKAEIPGCDFVVSLQIEIAKSILRFVGSRGGTLPGEIVAQPRATTILLSVSDFDLSQQLT